MKPDCVIFDIDGTAADGRHRQPLITPESGLKKDQDWKSYKAAAHRDERWDGLHFVYQAMVAHRAILAGIKQELGILFVSGRSEEEREVTEWWLKENEFFGYTKLMMRAAGDFRSDDIIKAEILERDILPNYNVKVVFDDRPRVVKMWKQHGLYVLCADQREDMTEF